MRRKWIGGRRGPDEIGGAWLFADEHGNAHLEKRDDTIVIAREDIATVALELTALVPQPAGMMTGELTPEGWEPDDDGAAAIAMLTDQVKRNADDAARAEQVAIATDRLAALHVRLTSWPDGALEGGRDHLAKLCGEAATALARLRATLPATEPPTALESIAEPHVELIQVGGGRSVPLAVFAPTAARLTADDKLGSADGADPGPGSTVAARVASIAASMPRDHAAALLPAAKALTEALIAGGPQPTPGTLLGRLVAAVRAAEGLPPPTRDHWPGYPLRVDLGRGIGAQVSVGELPGQPQTFALIADTDNDVTVTLDLQAAGVLRSAAGDDALWSVGERALAQAAAGLLIAGADAVRRAPELSRVTTMGRPVGDVPAAVALDAVAALGHAITQLVAVRTAGVTAAPGHGFHETAPAPVPGLVLGAVVLTLQRVARALGGSADEPQTGGDDGGRN